MKLSTIKDFFHWISAAILTLSLLFLGGCSTGEIQVANEALAALAGNKSLAEQFVKDVKTHVDPTDDEYTKILGTYEQARDEYNEYVSKVQSAVASGRLDFPSAESLDRLNQTSTAFISAAAKGIDPGYRRLQYDRAIVFPPKLDQSVRNLSRDARKLLADRVIAEMRWKPWSQL